MGITMLSILLTMGSIRCENQTGSSVGCSVENQVEDSLLANENWMSVSKSAHIYSKVPSSVDYQFGRTFWNAFLTPIPRVIWPEKPIVRSDILVEFDILGLPPERRTGASPRIVGEFYLNWGWPGVFVGMFLLGWFLRRIWDWYQQSQSDFAVSAFAVIAVHMALRLPQGDFTGSFVPAMQGLITLMFVMLVGSFFAKSDRTESISTCSAL